MIQTSFRGKTFSYDDVVDAMGRFDREIRVIYPAKNWVTYAIKHNDNLYPPKQIMRLVTGLANVGSGGKSLNARFEELGFEITTIDEDSPVTPGSITSESTETDIAFSLEYDLENSLVSNLDQLERGMQLYKANGLTGQQVDTRLVGRIDLLAIDAKGDLVVIELKAEEADRQVLGQIQAYMAWVRENLAGGKIVRGIIVANDFTTRAVYGAKVVPNLTLRKYQISFKFSDV